jgi:DME family drug/metabolite transporter
MSTTLIDMSTSITARRAQLAVALAALLFGTSAVATRVVANDLSALQLSAARITVGGLCLVLISARAGTAPWRHRVPARRVAIGAVAVIGLQVGFFGAVARLGVAAATVVTISAGPVTAGVVERWRHGVCLSSRWIAGAALALAGIALMSGGGWRVDPVGWAMAFGGGACLPVYGAVTRELMVDRRPITAIATVVGAAVPGALIVGVVASWRSGWPLAAGDVVVVGWLGVIATALAYVAWSIGLAGLTVRATVVVTMLEPVTATVLAAAVLGEPLPWFGRMGMLVVVAGVVTAGLERGVSSEPSRTPRGRAARSARAARWARPDRRRSDPIRR